MADARERLGNHSSHRSTSAEQITEEAIERWRSTMNHEISFAWAPKILSGPAATGTGLLFGGAEADSLIGGAGPTFFIAGAGSATMDAGTGCRVAEIDETAEEIKKNKSFRPPCVRRNCRKIENEVGSDVTNLRILPARVAARSTANGGIKEVQNFVY